MEGRAPRIRRAQLRLRIDGFTIEVIHALRGREVRAVLLKGPAIATWLYDDAESRTYVDADLLVDPTQLADSERALLGLEFERFSDDRVLQAFAEPHAVAWRRQRDQAAVDLHWQIPGLPADPQQAWRILSSDTEEVMIGGTSVEALAKPARTLHLALHALHNGRMSEKSMADLTRGVERIDERIWRAAAELAEKLGATATFAAGLRLTPNGDALADRLGLPNQLSERLALWAQTAPPGAVRLHELVTTPGVRAKGRRLGSALVPSPSYIRARYPSARTSTSALALAYLRRPIAGIRHAPGAVRALRRAREEARTSERDA